MVALEVESWIWWSLVILVAASRFISRRMTLGSFRKFQADDYLMILALCFYTSLISTINIVRHTSSNLLPPGFPLSKLTPQDKADREYGSKLILVVEQCQCATIWLVKGCLLCLYLRLTTLRKEHIAVKILAGYVVITFIVMDSLYFGYWCQPFHLYWAVPTPNPQCDAATNHLIMNASFNLSSDVAMLIIGLPMFLRMHLPWKKKIPLVLIFSLGIFTILAAILNKVYSFTDPFGAEWTYWYTRESSTALLVANLPFVWTFWRRVAGYQRSIVGKSRQGSRQLDGTIAETTTRKGSGEERYKPMTAEEWLASDAELEMAVVGEGAPGRAKGGMTLQDMLKADPVEGVDEKEVNPYTHPKLFFSRDRRKGSGSNPQSPIEKAVLSESPEQQTIRRDSSLDEQQRRGSRSHISSVLPSLTSKTSAGSFV